MEVLDISPAVVWVIALSQLLTFGLTLWNLMNSGVRRSAERLVIHSQRLADHDQRLSALEQAQGAMPSKDDMHAIHLGVSELRGDMKELRAVISGSSQVMGRLEKIVTRHEDYLLDGAKR